VSKKRHDELEGRHRIMNEDSPNRNLEHLSEHVAEQIIFTVGVASGDLKAEIMRLLRRYLADVEEQRCNDATRGQQLEERDQQN
jgi:hypothetical protein